MAPIRFLSSKFPITLSLKLALLTGLFLLVQAPSVLLAQGIPRRWEVKKYRPPIGIGAPRRTDGGGTRSGGSDSCPIVGSKPLTALVPSDRFGVTVSPYPSFFAYIPATSPQASPLAVEFELRDKDDKTLYQSTFKTTGKPGIVTINLPKQAGLAPLTIGQDYKWSFTIICQSDERSLDKFAEGWVRRVELDVTLKNRLQQASLQQQADLYAEAEIWQDALATLVQLRRNYPNDATITANWERLLSAAGLSALVTESLAASSTPATLNAQ